MYVYIYIYIYIHICPTISSPLPNLVPGFVGVHHVLQLDVAVAEPRENGNHADNDSSNDNSSSSTTTTTTTTTSDNSSKIGRNRVGRFARTGCTCMLVQVHRSRH